MNEEMTRREVYEVVNGERDYQIRETADSTRADMVEDFDMSKALLAIQHITNEALKVWYKESEHNAYQGTMEYIRKITAVGVQMGERYGMPERDTRAGRCPAG